jgi:hypothetical protein|tara:strand:- start:2598 stop:3149 length:552 start_codon:yes stop_codon:yes gene_type:complete
MAGLMAGIFMGSCSGHGTGAGASHHPGLGGGILPNCPHPSLSPTIVASPLPAVNAVAIWPPTPQQPLGVAKAVAARVFINKKVPIVDQDLLIPHPTPTQFTTTSVGKKCLTVRNTPAWWCTVGVEGGRETAKGHARKALATSKTVFIGGVNATRFGDPLGDGTPAFPCLSVITGASPNVFIGA